MKGQSKMSGPHDSLFSAINEFEYKFFEKTQNYWSERKEFESYQDYYTLLEMDYGEEVHGADMSLFAHQRFISL